jgi:hypothetical protein
VLIAFGVAWAGCLLVLLLLGRRAETRLLSDWEALLLTPRRDDQERLATILEVHLVRAKQLCGDAAAARELGAFDEAMRLMDTTYEIIRRFAPTPLRALAAMAMMSRVACALAAPAPLRPEGFRLRQLADLARLNQLVHRFLTTARARYRLHVYILGRNLVLLMTIVDDHIRRLRRHADDRDEEWRQIEEARHERRQLSAEARTTLIEARERLESPDLLWQLAERREQWRESPPTGRVVLWAALSCALLLALAFLR